ncbi:hypothetical protein Tco_0515092 [Tanacetum coccineum]
MYYVKPSLSMERVVASHFFLVQLSERTSSNIPTVAEVVALIINDFGDGEPIRDIVVNKKDCKPKGISELHLSYMALQYPLLFLYEEDGYHDNISYHTNTGKRKTTRDNLTTKEYYAAQWMTQWNNDARYMALQYPLWYMCHVFGSSINDSLFVNKPNKVYDARRPKLSCPLQWMTQWGYKVVTDYMLHEPYGKDVKSAACNVEAYDETDSELLFAGDSRSVEHKWKNFNGISRLDTT